jgi:PRC-barrel domain
MRKSLLAAFLLATASAMAPAFSQPSSTSPAPQRAMTLQPHQWRASKLIGVDVYSAENEKLGEINEILVDQDAHVQAVIGIGGLLGIAERNVVIPFRELEWRYGPPETTAPTTSQSDTATRRETVDNTRRGYPDFVVLRKSKAELQNAPRITY